jgi:pyruvate dehydrogenase E1 component beta subunit
MKGELTEPGNSDYLVPLGKARLVESAEPAQLTIICWSMAYYRVLEAVERLRAENIYADILDLRSLKPVDSEAIAAAAAKTHRLLIVQEATPVSSYGTWLSHHIQDIAFDELDAPVSVVSSDNVPMPYAFSLEPAVLPNVDRIVTAARELVA